MGISRPSLFIESADSATIIMIMIMTLCTLGVQLSVSECRYTSVKETHPLGTDGQDGQGSSLISCKLLINCFSRATGN